MSCPLARDDGAYVLGSLSPADRLEFERHLPGCADCTRAVGELAGLPGLLGRVPGEVLLAQESEQPVPPTLLSSLTRQVRVEQRRRTWRVAGLAAAAAAVVVALGAVAVAGFNDEGGSGTATPSSATSAVPSQTMQQVGNDPMAGDLSLTSVAWGTKLTLTCSYDDAWEESADSTYRLVVVTRAGTTEQVATWHGLPGKTMQLDAATATRVADMAMVEVQTGAGEAVLRLTE